MIEFVARRTAGRPAREIQLGVWSGSFITRSVRLMAFFRTAISAERIRAYFRKLVNARHLHCRADTC
jgi:hypothetical protein